MRLSYSKKRALLSGNSDKAIEKNIHLKHNRKEGKSQMAWLQYKFENGYVVGVFDDGRSMKFDVCDLEMVSAHRWRIDTCGYPSTTHLGKTVRLHRYLLNGNIPQGMVVDHINRDKLDNRRKNLRICTPKVNLHNVGLRSNNKSGTTGVFLDRKVMRWRSQISINGKTKHIGIFDRLEDAIASRKSAEAQYYQKEDD